MTTLPAIGIALYGEHWQAPMARFLRVSDRTVRRWVLGEHPVPAGAMDELTDQLRQQHARIAALLDERRDK
jgi:hypothetical protein